MLNKMREHLSPLGEFIDSTSSPYLNCADQGLHAHKKGVGNRSVTRGGRNLPASKLHAGPHGDAKHDFEEQSTREKAGSNLRHNLERKKCIRLYIYNI